MRDGTREGEKKPSQPPEMLDRPSIRPYDPTTGSINLISSVDSIIEFDNLFREITTGLPIPIRVGSILRASELAYPNWGIQVTDENRAELEKRAADFYKQDAEEGRLGTYEGDELHRLKKGLSAPKEERMATHIARLIKEMVLGSVKAIDPIRILDIACGSGRLSSSIATALSEFTGVLDRAEFHLVDYSDKLSKAENNLKAFGLNIVPHPMTDDQFFATNRENFNFVVSLSHLHRRPFLASYLAKVYSRMSDDGVLMIGDWHSALCQHPSHVYLLLQNMGLEHARLNRFDELFGPLHLSAGADRFNDPELAGVMDQYKYWRDMFAGLGEKRYEGAMRLRIMSAFTTNKQLMEEMDKAGFTTHIDDIRMAFPRSALPNAFPIRMKLGSDSAAVTVAMKKAIAR